jgi:L-seryl-tRNA(Ser) seleniumtransferase
MTDARRKVPSVDGLLRSAPGRRAAASLGRPLLKQTLADVLGDARDAAASGADPPPAEVLLARAAGRASRVVGGLTPVINATGVLLHTNLGRAPVPEAAARAAARAARSYTDLEVDRETGTRGRRSSRAETMLTAITGAEAALVVNNCAAALLLSLATLARRKEVPVSRGELIEIGGEFRIPDIVAASGAKLVEVGTTNRTRLTDYRAAVNDRTGAILKVHPSNYRVVGFTASPGTAELAALASTSRVPFLYDVGSGSVDRSGADGVPADEPDMQQTIAEGADLVMSSGDKLLGGPQTGIVLGRADLIERLRRHPIARAVRVDKMQVAALEAVLAMYVRGQQDSIPVHGMLRESAEHVKLRARHLAQTVGGDLEGARVRRCESVVGGGSVPGSALPSWGVAVRCPDPPAFAARMRDGSPPVFCRVESDGVLFDLRTVRDDEVPDLARAIWYALEGDDLQED